MVEAIKDWLLAENDRTLAVEFIPLLVREFERIDGEMAWGYPDEVSDHITNLREYFS